MTNILSDYVLTKKLRKMARLNSESARLLDDVYKHSLEVYGFAPSLCDSFVDLCDGGCGQSDGMTAKEFDQEMQRVKSNLDFEKHQERM